MATYLEMVNRTLELLRFDAVTSISGAADPVTLVGNIVNRAARTVLEHRIWSFLIRDAQLQMPARVSGTGAEVFSDGSIAIPQADISTAIFGDSFTTWHLQITEDTNYGDTSFGVVSFQTAGGAHIPTLLGVGLYSPYAAAASLSYRLVPNIRKFPANVRQILSARYQQNPLEIVQESRNDLNALIPDWQDEDGQPRRIFIGGLTSPTFDATLGVPSGVANQTQSYGPRMLIWPAPTSKEIIDLDVVWRHDVMTADANTLTGVPDHICDLIVLRSAVDGLLGQVVADVERGNALSREFAVSLGRAIASDQSDPNRRRVLRTFGSSSSGSSFDRWPSRTITGSTWSGF